MDNLSKNRILASSSGWVALALNFLPGLGAGYLYQRRWLAYFITAGVVTSWFAAGVILNGEAKDPSSSEQIIGIGGVFIISITTMIEAKVAHKKSLVASEEELKLNQKKKRGGLFG